MDDDMDTVELADLDPFDIFDIEAERLDRFFSSLDDAQWGRQSRCAGWSVRDVLAHLAGEELYNHACIDGDLPGFFAMLDRADLGRAGVDGFNEWTVRERRDLPVADVLDEWRTANGQTRARMRELGRDAELTTMVGPYPAGMQAFHYASEYATHADDVDAPVDPAEEPGRTHWRARLACFVLREQGDPAQVAPGGNGTLRVSVGDRSAELSEPDFVTASVARLPGDHRIDPRLRDALAVLA